LLVSVYIPGLFLTGSKPDKTSIAFELYELANLFMCTLFI
jgi:hypothetical protein